MDRETTLVRARALLAAGDRGGAASAFMQALQSSPECAEAMLELARLHLDAGRHRHGRELVLKALGAPLEGPGDAVLLARELLAIGESRILREVAAQVPMEAWDSPTQLTEFARYLAAAGLHDQADRYLLKALSKDASHPPANFAMATQDVAFGRFAEASAHVARCLEALPDDPGAHWLRSRLRLPEPGPRIERLKSLLALADEPNARAWFGYALHNELHECGRHAEAWTALQAGAEAKRSAIRYDVEAQRALFEALAGVDAAECRRDDGHRDADVVPVFIVGHYRSGTTLLERLLGGHPAISAGGESYDFPSALRRECGLHFRGESHEHAVRSRSAFDYARMGKGYLEAMRWRARGRPVVTDKLPGNVLNAGAIVRALPEARIVLMRRSPLEVGLSSFRTLFGDACPYSYDVAEFAAYHHRQEALIEHWRRVLPPGRLFEVDYAELVDDPRASLSPLLAALGLQFDEAMLDLRRTGDAVSTASSVLVRDGLRKDRGTLVDAYAPWLAPLADALGVPRPTPA